MVRTSEHTFAPIDYANSAHRMSEKEEHLFYRCKSSSGDLLAGGFAKLRWLMLITSTRQQVSQ